MKIIPNTKQPGIGSILEWKEDGKQYVIDRGGLGYWVLRDGSGTSVLIYQNELMKLLFKHEVKILN